MLNKTINHLLSNLYIYLYENQVSNVLVKIIWFDKKLDEKNNNIEWTHESKRKQLSFFYTKIENIYVKYILKFYCFCWRCYDAGWLLLLLLSVSVLIFFSLQILSLQFKSLTTQPEKKTTAVKTFSKLNCHQSSIAIFQQVYTLFWVVGLYFSNDFFKLKKKEKK